MKFFRWLSFITLLLLLSVSRVHAALMLTFNPDFVWDASHVVIVNPQGRVLESLKGDLKPNVQLSLSDLKVSNEISVDLQPYGVPTQTEKISSEKLLLLLDRKKSGFKLHGVQLGFFVEGSETISVAWFAHGNAYATAQINNPGPVRVVAFGDEKTFRQRLVNILNTQKALQIATKTPLKKRAQEISSFMKTHAHWLHGTAFRETLGALSLCGQSATPIYLALLNDWKMRWMYRFVALSFADAVGEKSGATFTAVVEKELVYWRRTSPHLCIGWWNNAPKQGFSQREIEALRVHYERLDGALNALKRFRYPPCKSVVTQTRALWRALPQLEARKFSGPIGESCDTILKRLN